MRFYTARTVGTLLFSVTLLAACNTAPTRVSLDNQPPLRAAVHEFTDALRSGDEAKLVSITTVDSDRPTRKLGRAVVDDYIASRQIQIQLEKQFHRADNIASVVGSDPWIDSFEHTGGTAVILQAGDRVRIGDGEDGTVFLRRIDGQWKVELVPTLVPESGGRAKVSDPVVQYRFEATCAANQHMLAMLKDGEFSSLLAFQEAKNKFWFQYMMVAANGDDPREKLLSTLPPLPGQPAAVAADR